MADEIIIETTSQEVVEIGVVGPQGPRGADGAGLTTLTTAGDLLYRNATEPTRLPVGSNGQVLKVSGGLPSWGNESGAVTSVNGESGAVVLDGSDIDASGNDVRAAFTMSAFGDGDGIYYPLPDQFINTKPIYRTTSGYSVYFENSRWHIADGSPITANIIESSDDDNTAFPWLSAWSGDVNRAKLADVVGRARDTFLFLGDSIPNSSVSGLSSVAASGAYNDLTGKPTLGTASTKDAPATGNASSTQVVLGNDTRLSDSRSPSLHSSSHAAAGSDPVFDQNLNSTDDVAFNEVSIAGGGKIYFGDAATFEADGELYLSAASGLLAKDTELQIVGTTTLSKRLRFDSETNIPADTTVVLTSPAISGTLALTTTAPASHAHGNISNTGTIGSTAGLPLVTTTAGAVTTLALGTAGQVLTVNSGATGVEFAAAAGGGSSIMQSIAVGFVLN